MPKNYKKGFTLIELLVVVAIMALLASLAIVALNQARARARDARRVSDIKQIQTALEMYFLDKYQYPDGAGVTLDGKCLSGSNGLNDTCSGTVYMAKMPANPYPRTDGGCGNTSYTYWVDTGGGTNLSYHIIYCLGSATGDLSAGLRVATPAGL